MRPKPGRGELPLLYHLKVSHYNEKARWALDYKRVPHARKAVLPGAQPRVARKLTGGSTLPILVLGGEAIGDSTRIIAAVEARRPDSPLYPDDPEARDHALELEEFFDEEFGPHIRLLVIHHLLSEADVFLGAFMPDLRGAPRAAARATFPALARRISAAFRINPETIGQAWERVAAAGERFKQTVRPSGYLVGEQFTVADLTLAALTSPAATPEQFPYPQPQRSSQCVEPLRQAVAQSGLLDWTREIYARHRPDSAEVSGAERARTGARAAGQAPGPGLPNA